MPARFRATLVALGLLVALLSPTAPASADNVVTPGDFTGYGFDQCLAPTQKAMDVWWLNSPFTGVGIYISGNSRACRSQPNLTPEWVSRQLAAGWRLLPITLGPQASCSTRYPRYGAKIDPTIKSDPTNRYAAARAQGVAEADTAVAAAAALGIVRGSTLWYDLEGFDSSQTNCRESAKAFLSSWTEQLHARGYVSGVYSSASSGMRMLDQARINAQPYITLPDRLWIADWNGKADVYSTYISNEGWMPHARMHQYRGGHNETHGGVTINIDSNWIDLGRGSWIAAEPKHCGSVNYNLSTWLPLTQGTNATANVRALQCMLRSRKLYPTNTLTGVYDATTIKAVRAYQARRGLTVQDRWTLKAWTVLLAEGTQPVSKFGSASTGVRRLQRALNAAGAGKPAVTGIVDATTVSAIKTYQTRVGLSANGVAGPSTWQALSTGKSVQRRR